MDTKDKKNSPVVDEYVNVESEAVVNEGNPGAGKVEGEKEESQFFEKAVETAKVVAKVTSGAAKTAGIVVGGVAKSAGFFTNIASFFVANLQTILIAMAITSAAGLVGYIVKDMFEKAEGIPALIPVLPCVDTMKVLYRNGDELVTAEGQSVDRSVLYGAQTPQIFHSEILKQAYEQAYDTAFTDDASVVLKYGKNLSYLLGERFNIKLTTQDDLVLAKAILSLSDSSSR